MHCLSPRLRSTSNSRSDRRGTATVETAIVMSFIFVPLLLGFFEFGRVMQAGQVVTTGSRYGVRSAILAGSTEAAVRTEVQNFVSGTLGMPAGKVTVTFNVTPAPGNPASLKIDTAQAKDLVQVTVGVNYNDISVVTGKFMKGQTITSSSAMRHE